MQKRLLRWRMDKYVIKGGNPLVGEVEIGGAKNAAILAAEILALGDKAISDKLDAYREEQAEKIRNTTI